MNRKHPCIVGIDIGTSHVTACAFDQRGRLIVHASEPMPTLTYGGGLAEHNPEALWQTVVNTLKHAVDNIPLEYEVVALSLATLGEAGLPLDSEKRPLRNIIAWYDMRALDQVRWWLAAAGGYAIYKITGLTVDTYYGVNKLMWIRENEPDIYQKTRYWLSLFDYIILRLTDVIVTEFTIATRTMLVDLRKQNWSEELINLAGLKQDMFPKILPSGSIVGSLSSDAAREIGLVGGIPVVAAGQDHLCSAFIARGGTRFVVDSTGTAEALLVPSLEAKLDEAAFKAHITCRPDIVPGNFLFSARIGMTGNLLKWALESLLSCNQPKQLEDMLAQIGPNRRFSGIICLPTFGRGISPHWALEHAPGVLYGLTTLHSRSDILQGILEGIGFALLNNIEWFENTWGIRIEQLIAEGGSTRSSVLTQIKSDITGRMIEAVEISQPTALGAAMIAASSVGLYQSLENAARAVELPKIRYFPDMDQHPVYQDAYEKGYKKVLSALEPVMLGN